MSPIWSPGTAETNSCPLLRTARHDAAEMAGRIQREVDNRAFEVSPGRSVSVGISIGCASWSEDGNTLEELLHAADVAMYGDKGIGRARIVVPCDAERGFAQQPGVRVLSTHFASPHIITLLLCWPEPSPASWILASHYSELRRAENSLLLWNSPSNTDVAGE